MENGIKRDGKYKYATGRIEPYETFDFDEMFVRFISPIQTFFETLCKCEDWDQRGIGEMGLCLLRDTSEHWDKFSDAITKHIGEIELDVNAEGKEENIVEAWEHPNYIGMAIVAAPKKEGAENGKG